MTDRSVNALTKLKQTFVCSVAEIGFCILSKPFLGECLELYCLRLVAFFTFFLKKHCLPIDFFFNLFWSHVLIGSPCFLPNDLLAIRVITA